MKKKYILDTSVLIESEKSIEKLINGNENKILITKTVLNELSGLKKDNKLKERVIKIIDEILLHEKNIEIIDCQSRLNNDDLILKDILNSNLIDDENTIFVTNDKLLSLKAIKNGIKTQEYKESIPFESESEIYTGIVGEDEEKINNCFYWKKGKVFQYFNKSEKIIDYENIIWGIKPKNVYQNMAFELLNNPEINLVSIQSKAGCGKTYLSLASAFNLVFQKKIYEKIIIIKSNIDIGKDLGFLPGSVSEKIEPYFKPIENLILKLYKIRPNKKIYTEDKKINNEFIEFWPLNFIRGCTIENSVVLIDEIQNLDLHELKTILSRMGNNVKLICCGDVSQIDVQYLSRWNNGMNWLTKLFKNEQLYGHIVLKGNNIRGPICDLINSKNI